MLLARNASARLPPTTEARRPGLAPWQHGIREGRPSRAARLKRKRSVISADGSMITGPSGGDNASARCPIPSPGYEGDVGGVPSASDTPSVLGDE